MTEDEVNKICRNWIRRQGFHYKGILNRGKGQVPVPDGTRSVLIDHQGTKDNPIDLIWVEAKGSGCNLSELLEGFIRVAYAVWHGAGRGLLAAPAKEVAILRKQKDFLASISSGLGLLDVESGDALWI